jgi:hypothetical protein
VTRSTDDPAFGPQLPLVSDRPGRSRRAQGAIALAVGLAVLAAALALVVSRGASALVAVLGVVAFAALRQAFRYLVGPGLPVFYETGLVDRGRRMPYAALVEARATATRREQRGSFLHTEHAVRLCARDGADVLWTITSADPHFPDVETVLSALRRANPSIAVRRSDGEPVAESLRILR